MFKLRRLSCSNIRKIPNRGSTKTLRQRRQEPLPDLSIPNSSTPKRYQLFFCHSMTQRYLRITLQETQRQCPNNNCLQCFKRSSSFKHKIHLIDSYHCKSFPWRLYLPSDRLNQPKPDCWQKHLLINLWH